MLSALRGSGNAKIAGIMICMAAGLACGPQLNAQQSRTVEIPAPANADPLLAKADAEVRRILLSRGYGIAESAPFRIELAWSRRPNDVALRPGADGNTMQASATPVKRRVDLCEDAIHRLVVAMIETQSGTVTYRGSAEVNRCRAPTDENVEAMVRQSLAGLS